VGHTGGRGETRNAYRILVGETEEKKPLVGHGLTRENKFKMTYRLLGYGLD
jgi:hypothetical protein